MIPRFFLLTGLLSLALAAWPARATACQLTSRIEPRVLSSEWQRAVESLERAVAASDASVCHGVELVVSLEDGAVTVTAQARDGVAKRRVRSPTGLSAVAFGLLAVAPNEATPATAERLELPPPTETIPKPPPPPAVWAVAFTGATGVRGLFPTRVLVGELEAGLDVHYHAWIVTLAMRASPVTLVGRGGFDPDSYQETGFALGVGRELELGRSVLSLRGTSGITYVWIESDSANESSEQPQLRLAGVGRWAFSVGHAVRLTATIDGEIAPTGVANGASQVGLPKYPAFTVAGRLGAEVAL
jgi:hypothetical protein